MFGIVSPRNNDFFWEFIFLCSACQAGSICDNSLEKGQVSDSCQQIASSGDEIDADLTVLNERWAALPAVVKAAIMAMAKEATR